VVLRGDHGLLHHGGGSREGLVNVGPCQRWSREALGGGCGGGEVEENAQRMLRAVEVVGFGVGLADDVEACADSEADVDVVEPRLLLTAHLPTAHRPPPLPAEASGCSDSCVLDADRSTIVANQFVLPRNRLWRSPAVDVGFEVAPARVRQMDLRLRAEQLENLLLACGREVLGQAPNEETFRQRSPL